MTSIVELFPKCRKLAYDARQQIAMTSNSTNNSGWSEVHMVIEELNRQLDRMEDLVVRETPAQRTVWKRKIAEVRHEASTLSQQATTLSNRHYRASQTASYRSSQRDELLTHRQKRDDTELQTLAAESQSLAQSQTMVMDILQSGAQSFQELQQQRQRLRGVTRVVADIGSSLGLSQATMRIIERRDITDAYFVAAGMVITLIVIYVTWF